MVMRNMEHGFSECVYPLLLHNLFSFPYFGGFVIHLVFLLKLFCILTYLMVNRPIGLITLSFFFLPSLCLSLVLLAWFF